MSDMPAATSARPTSKVAVFLRLLGALLCVGGVALMVGSEAYVLHNRAGLKQAQLDRRVAAVSPPGAPFYSVVTGPQQDLCIVPGVVALLVIGVRMLLGKSPGIAPPVAALLLGGGALATYALLIPFPFGISRNTCSIVLMGSFQPLFPLGLLAGLVGSIVLSRTTRYHRLRLEDA